MKNKEIAELIESWEKEKIAAALALMKKEKIAESEILSRYQYLLDAIGGKTLKALADFPVKWNKLSNEVKVGLIESYPDELPFFIQKLNLNASRRVDAWRDSHYKNQIEKLPLAIGKLKNVTELHMEYQQFKELPEAIGELENLEVLKLLDNDLTSLPDSLSNLKKLRVLILAQNYGLKKIPDLSGFQDLEEIDFEYTKIDTLPEAFYELKNIRKIVIAGSPLDKNLKIVRRLIETFPDAEIDTNSRNALAIEDNVDENQYKDQEIIRINEHSINYLPKQLFEANTVRKLTIDCWNLLELPDTFDKLQTLEVLTLRAIGVKEFPASIFRLKNLKELYIDGEFTLLADNISELESLEHFEIKIARLEKLPATFSELKSLKTMIVKYSAYDIFPVIANLRKLETLELTECRAPFKIEKPLDSLVSLKNVVLGVANQITDDIYNLPNTILKLELEDDTWKEKLTALSLGKLVNHFSRLEKLQLRAINLSDVSVPIEVNHSLKEIVFYDPKFTDLPDTISNLVALESVTLFGLRIHSLNPAIYDCPNLAYFRTSNTLFKTIPEGISRMKKIACLGFERGSLESLPADIYELSQLEQISLEDCPLYHDKDFKTLIKKKIKGIRITKSWYS